MPKPNETRRIQLDKKERAAILVLAIARSEAQNAYTERVTDALKARGVDVTTTDWNYDPLTGTAVRIR